MRSAAPSQRGGGAQVGATASIETTRDAQHVAARIVFFGDHAGERRGSMARQGEP